MKNMNTQNGEFMTPEVMNAHNEIHALGHLGETYYYTSTSNQQVISISRAGHTKVTLLDLMPIDHWRSGYEKKSTIDWDSAASDLMSACRARGIYSPERIRGVGVWKDDGRIVLNLGNALSVDGISTPLRGLASRFTYQIGTPIERPHESPLTQTDAAQLIHAFTSLKWKKPEHALFMLGWIVIAPICGILPWRPHLWLNGPAGSGKSWLLQTIVSRMFGSNRYFFQGNTTEAGIRQTIGASAKPVIFDEFETDDLRSAERVRSVLELIRQASSESDGAIVKGSATGIATQYSVRFSCLVASVRVNLPHEQDKTRFTVIDLERVENDKQAHFARVNAAFSGINESYAARLFTRTLNRVSLIQGNAQKIANALSEQYNPRFGQQYGWLLGGYSSLLSDEPISDESLKALIEDINLREESLVIHERDEEDCLEYLLRKLISVDMAGQRRELSILELIQHAVRVPYDSPILERIGLRVIENHLYISNRHPTLDQLFAGTKWVGGWRKALQRVKGAGSFGGTVRFGARSTRCVYLPLAEIIEPDSTEPCPF